jgi:transposase
VLARRDDNAPEVEPPDALALAKADTLQLPLALAERECGDAPRPTTPTRLSAFVDGFSLHAATFVRPDDRAALERLARYLLRPALAADRVTRRDDGKVEVRFRKPDPSGRTSWVGTGAELCRRLAAILPPPRSHGVRYHGVLSSAHHLRPHVIPCVATEPGDPSPATTPPASVLARRLDWAALLQRVWGPDVTTCPRCHGDLRVLAFITAPDVTAAILDHLGLIAAPVPIAPARAPPPPWSDDPA